jgi:putative FmdB family regulatory protein
MPMYEFDCADCHESFEELVLSGSDVDSVSCPSCTSHRVSKKLSAFAVGAASGGSFDTGYSGGSSCSGGGCCSGSCG